VPSDPCPAPLKSDDVLAVLTELIAQRGKPGMIVSDNVLGWEAAAETGQQVLVRQLRTALLAF